MKKNIDYYPHKTEAHRHPKFKMLRSMYPSIEEGWAAEGRFWALNNLIAQSEDCQLDLTKKRNKGVFADELGMSIGEFEQFIEVLCSEDVELLTQIDTNIYTTDTVKETYESVATERKKAKDRYQKSAKNSTSDENNNSSGENSESSGEAGYKVNKSEVNKSELNKSEVKGKNSTFLKSHFGKIKSLFSEHTKISDPNETTHLLPVAEFYSHIPEHLTENDISKAITESFSKLDKTKGVRIDLLTSNIQAKITALHEEKLKKLKEPELKQAEIDRKEQKKYEVLSQEEEKKNMAKKYREFFDAHEDLFTRAEKDEILRLSETNKVFHLGFIIEPKIQSLELKES